MKIVRIGITRIVFLTNNYAIKIPNFRYSWIIFLKGLIANVSEQYLYRSSSDENKKLLCPVVWSSWGGWILVMSRVDTKRHYLEVYNSAKSKDIDPDWQTRERYKKWFDAGLSGDDKCANYGYLNEQLVKIDYQ